MPVTGIPDVSPSRGTVLSIYALAYFASFGNPLVMPLLPFIAAEFSLSPLELGLMISGGVRHSCVRCAGRSPGA